MDGTEWKYNYYPDGMRYSKSYGEVLTFENEDQELIVDNGEKTTRFVYDNGDIIAETFYSQIFEDDNIEFEGLNLYYRGYEIVKNNEGVYFNYNGQGDVAFLTDESGETVADYSYDAYGNLAERNLYYNPFGYRGEYTDTETGLVYLRNRYYDPKLGRFLTQDPIMDGLNWYAYCAGDPVNRIDMLGLYYLETDENGNVYAVIEEGDTLAGIAKAEVNDESAWTKMGYEGDPGNLQIGERVNITGIYNENYPIPKFNSTNTVIIDGTIRGIYYETNFFDPSCLSEDCIFVDGKLVATSKEAAIKLKETEDRTWDMIYGIALGTKLDLKQVNQVASKMGITGNARRAFGKYIESYKKEVGKPGNANFSWEELIEIAKEFIER